MTGVTAHDLRLVFGDRVEFAGSTRWHGGWMNRSA